MILKGDLITKADAQNAFFSSYEGKYTIMDNLDEKLDPVVHARDEIYNSEYVYITVVLRGTLSLIIGGTPIEMKANEYLAVMPCMSVVVKESRCIYFTFLTSSNLMAGWSRSLSQAVMISRSENPSWPTILFIIRIT